MIVLILSALSSHPGWVSKNKPELVIFFSVKRFASFTEPSGLKPVASIYLYDCSSASLSWSLLNFDKSNAPPINDRSRPIDVMMGCVFLRLLLL